MRKTLEAFAAARVVDDACVDPGRRLVVRVETTREVVGRPLELLLLKNADVPTWVEHGVAEIGVCGTDVLDEHDADVWRPHTFGFGACRIAIAARAGTTAADLRARPVLRVATKYTRTAARWFATRGQAVDLIKLSGSVELGATLGLADAIVDLVETGRTLVENDLEVVEVIGQTRVKLIANRSLGRDQAAVVDRLVEALAAATTEPS
jgi:ATP phosphoribosyltransferase